MDVIGGVVGLQALEVRIGGVGGVIGVGDDTLDGLPLLLHAFRHGNLALIHRSLQRDKQTL